MHDDQETKKKCDCCGEDADYFSQAEGKAFCYACAKKEFDIRYSWCRHCFTCGTELDPKSMYIMQDPDDNEEIRSYCSIDCAMEDLDFVSLEADAEFPMT